MCANELKKSFNKIDQHTTFLDDELNEVCLSDVNQLNWTGDSPLHIAAQMNYVSDILVLLNHGANVNARGERGQTPLHVAVKQGNIDIVKILIDRGADLKLKNEFKKTPLDWTDSSEVKEILLKVVRRKHL